MTEAKLTPRKGAKKINTTTNVIVMRDPHAIIAEIDCRARFA